MSTDRDDDRMVGPPPPVYAPGETIPPLRIVTPDGREMTAEEFEDDDDIGDLDELDAAFEGR